MLAQKSTPEERAVLAALGDFTDEEFRALVAAATALGAARAMVLSAFYAAELARRQSMMHPCRWCGTLFLPAQRSERYCQDEPCRRLGFERAKHRCRGNGRKPRPEPRQDD